MAAKLLPPGVGGRFPRRMNIPFICIRFNQNPGRVVNNIDNHSHYH